MRYARGRRECFANCLSVASPIPLVAPTKTATRFGGRAEAMREFEDWIEEKETIVTEAGNDAILEPVRGVSAKEQARIYHLLSYNRNA